MGTQTQVGEARIQDYVAKLLAAFRAILATDGVEEHRLLVDEARDLREQMTMEERREADRLYFDGIRRITAEQIK